MIILSEEGAMKHSELSLRTTEFIRLNVYQGKRREWPHSFAFFAKGWGSDAVGSAGFDLASLRSESKALPRVKLHTGSQSSNERHRQN